MTPTQADREAAMMIRRLTAARLQEAGFTVSGISDPEDDLLIQAFTRHRLAAETAAFEKAAGVALREVRDEGNGAAVKANAGIIYQDIRKLAGEKHD